ncbi:MAG TPA: PIG-L family deacetylase, partial [Acetobacteraceae bacterium]|nr:PIG-L family deacetylase [Acetobacteraceae bacterium]
MPTALFLSPHLDDVVFSCGGLAARLADQGWRTVMATAFTASILPATGFALECQLDKGLPPDLDYMQLRREEDRRAAEILGVEPRWLDLPEAPHRLYASAPELFAEIRRDDDIWRPLAARLETLIDELRPDQLFAPQGLGGHVDHRQMIRAVQRVAGAVPVAYYRDTPYAIRNPNAPAHVETTPETVVPIGPALDRKIHAACAYASQIGFQFGGPAAVAIALTEFAIGEGQGDPAERFCGIFRQDGFQP